jgi:predicted nucleic acid-binding protein
MPLVTSSVPEPVVVDASAVVEALIGTQLGSRVRARMRGCELHAPAHLDAEVLSALGRLHRAGDLDAGSVGAALSELATAPITRHHLAGLLDGAWAARDQLRLVDALYVELATAVPAALLTTDARLSRACATAELLSETAQQA